MRSMTGFASQTVTTDQFELYIEIKSVNSRYFDFRLRGASQFNALEIEIKKRVQNRLHRGKVDLLVKLTEKSADHYEVIVNHELAKKYADVFRHLSREFSILSEVNIQDFIGLEGLLSVERTELDDNIIQAVFQTLDSTLDQMVNMMEIEGQKTMDDIQSSLDTITKSIGIIEERYGESIKVYRENLKLRLQELLNGEIDENRLLMETEIVASRSAINEEVVRLSSHLHQFDQIISGKLRGDAKKLDFVSQEMNRETNTIASKSHDVEIIQETITIKGEIEKIREQLRNLV